MFLKQIALLLEMEGILQGFFRKTSCLLLGNEQNLFGNATRRCASSPGDPHVCTLWSRWRLLDTAWSHLQIEFQKWKTEKQKRLHIIQLYHRNTTFAGILYLFARSDASDSEFLRVLRSWHRFSHGLYHHTYHNLTLWNDLDRFTKHVITLFLRRSDMEQYCSCYVRLRHRDPKCHVFDTEMHLPPKLGSTKMRRQRCVLRHMAYRRPYKLQEVKDESTESNSNHGRGSTNQNQTIIYI